MQYDVVVVGAGPSGATAAEDLARSGHKVAFIDRDGRIKPCGGAVPPRLIENFFIPDGQIVAKGKTPRMISPTGPPGERSEGSRVGEEGKSRWAAEP